MQRETRWRVFLWYKAGRLRARVLTLDFMTYGGAERYVLDMLPPWYGAATRTLTVIPTITEVVG